MSRTLKIALLTVVMWGLAATAAWAQQPATIDAVDAGGSRWEPSEVTITAGQTVTWEFDQATAPHTVTSSSPNWTKDETRQPGGAAVEQRFDTPGTYTFLCKFHGAMTGTITVEPKFDVLVFSRTTGFRHADAIAAGRTAISQMGDAGGYKVDLTEDATRFTDAGLRPYEVVVFLNTDGEGILDAKQRTAFERWTQRGGGIVSIHADANADRNWAWKGDMMGGAWFNNHPDGALQFQQATVNRVDDTHPATVDVPENWVRTDEWYNFTAEPKNVHVLLKLDESTYVEQDGSDGVDDDHPIAWCSNYDGGRHFYTALGHYGTYWSEPFYQAHIRGAIAWASGEAQGDCGDERPGIPTDASFDKVKLDDNTENPMEIAVADDGRVYYVELAGKVKRYDPANNSVRTVGTIPVHRGNENGLLGITLDPNFAQNNQLYVFYSSLPQEGPTGFQHVSRFTLGADGNIDMASEKVLLRIFHQRIVCCHSSGSLAFGPDGNLYISTGDDNEHAASSGYSPHDDDVRRNNVPGDPENDANKAYDSRRTSGNTNDLRGKILRIRPKANPTGEPGPGNTYDIPAGNLYGLGGKYAGVEGKTRPEIYTMGHRNPFRIAIDSETGWVYNGEVGPDANADSATRGPRGYDEINQIREAGNMGWPYCIADNKAYREWTFPNGPAGAAFDCSGTPGGGPANTSLYNTGLAQTPPTTGAMLWWPYGASPDFPQIPNGPGRTAIAGPTYHFDPANPSTTKFPAYYDDKVFFADWSRDWVATVTLDAQGKPVPGGIEEFMPAADFAHPHDMAMGKNGSLYILEWGKNFNYAGAGVNEDSGLYRIDYAKGTRTPEAVASANKDSGPAPLTVTFSSEGSADADGDELTYSWDFDDGTPNGSGETITHTFQNAGTYTVRLTATDSTGKAGTSTVVITAGNTRPKVELDVPVQGGVFDWGDEIPYTVTVTDPEDGPIDCNKVTVNPGVFHDEGGNAHVHPGVSKTGCSGVYEVPAESGHEKSAIIALVLTATYTDTGGAGGDNPLQGASTRKLNPKTIQAEHYTGTTGTQLNDRPAAEGGRRVGFNDAGEWIYFENISLKGIDKVTVRYTSGGNGGLVDFRLDAPDGPVVGTADLPNNGGWDTYSEVTAALNPPDDEPHKLYLAYRARPGSPGTDLFDLDELRFGGKGVASNSAPSASAQASRTSGPAPLNVSFTGTGDDPDGGTLTYAWDFTSDGTVDATTANAAHTYTEPGEHTATFKVSDGKLSRTVQVKIAVTPPLSACPGNDDFEGTSLDTSRWSVVRHDDRFLSVANGTLNLNAQPGEDIHGGATGQRNIVLQDLPDSGPWTATARVTWTPTLNYQNAGLVIYQDDANWIKSGMVWSNGRAFEAFKELNNNASGLGAQSVDASFPNTFYVRFTSDGTVVRAQRSADGQTWANTGNATNLSGLTNPRIGMYATASINAGTQANTARFDSFTLDAPQDASDEFDGTSLNLCRWSQTVRHDPTGYSVGGGKLTLPAAHGDFFANGANNNPNILLQPAPSGPWTMTTRLTFDPNENFEQAGLLVYGDDANYVKADYVFANGRGLEFLRESNNSAEGFGGFVNIATRPTTVDMRIVSDGTTLRGYYRFEGGAWTLYGEPAALSSVPNPKIGVYANDSNATVTSRNDAVFDFFRIQAGVADTTAPTTTHTLAPAANAAGWNNGNVTLTLATEAGATTQYKLGDGAFQSYTGPVALSDEGTTVVTYRSTDDEGNVEAEKTATVKIDKTAPTSTATPNGGTFTESAQVTLAGADTGSGLDKLEYRLDGGDWTTYTAPVTISGNGPHTLEHRATDAAGNAGTVGSGSYTITGAPPACPVRDEFEGSALNAQRWDVVRPDPAFMNVSGGAVNITGQRGQDIFANDTGLENIVRWSSALPASGPWTATTKMTWSPTANYQNAGLLIYTDDANWIKTGMVWNGGRAIETIKEVNNTPSFPGSATVPAAFPSTFYLRFVRDGNAIQAQRSADGVAWTNTGTATNLTGLTNPRFALYATGSTAAPPAGEVAKVANFDWFRFNPLVAGSDTTAPATTPTLSPAAPNGQNGWYTSNVELTLGTEDCATTQYKVGGGSFQDYAGPVALSDEGTTVVTYRSTDAEGNVEADKTVTVKLDKTAPTSTATPDGGTFTQPTQVTLAGADGGSGLDKLEYRLDGGAWTTYTGPVTISGNGQHTLERRASDAAGNVSAVASGTYTIQSGVPTVEGFADPSSGPAPLRVHFSATGFDPDGGAPLTYRWTLGDGTVIGPEFDYTFRTPGTYTATVTATDDEGMTASDEVVVEVAEPGGEAPTVQATVDKPSGPAPLAVKFSATGSDDGPADELVYHWDFGDGGTSFDEDPDHTYEVKGTYTAKVTVTDAAGKSGTAEVVVQVTDPPGNRAPSVEAAAAPRSGNAPLEVLFTAQGTDPDRDDLTYAWDFGDGDGASGWRATHTYTQGGTYTAKVTVTDEGGLTASATVAITVGNPPGNQAPTVQLAADPKRGTAPLKVRFTSSARDPEREGLMYVWEFGDGGRAGGPSATHTYRTPGTYDAKLTVTDPHGASGSATVRIVVEPLQGSVRAAQAELTVPSSVQAFGTRGLMVRLACESTAGGRATAKVTRATARRLGLASRTLAAKRLSCAAGRKATVRLKPSRSTGRQLVRSGAKRLRLSLAVSVGGKGALNRKVTIR